MDQLDIGKMFALVVAAALVMLLVFVGLRAGDEETYRQAQGQHVVSCAAKFDPSQPYDLAMVRDGLGCFRGGGATRTAKDQLAINLSTACYAFADMDVNEVWDIDSRGIHPLSLPEVKGARALGREIKDA